MKSVEMVEVVVVVSSIRTVAMGASLVLPACAFFVFPESLGPLRRNLG